MSAKTPELGVSAVPQILVIEDNPDGRETLRTLLASEGYQVEVAANGLEGLDKALASHPNIALVDIGLPLLDGYQVAKRLRSLFGRSIFLIACTAYGRAEDRRRSREAGFDVHLVKPIDPDELTQFFPKGGESRP
jgi:CheY-like chemotaxis protein